MHFLRWFGNGKSASVYKSSRPGRETGYPEVKTELPEKSGGLNRSMQHHLISIIFRKVVLMTQGKRDRLSAEQRTDMWRRWKAGESLHEIGRAFGKDHGSIQFLLSQRGGIVPAARRRSLRTLTLAEREDISRGIASGSSIREIAKGLQRTAPTVSREVARHGGRPFYRANEADHQAANEADHQAWEAALRPKACRLATHVKLRTIVASKLSAGNSAGRPGRDSDPGRLTEAALAGHLCRR
jgi:Helix-turn-helix domain